MRDNMGELIPVGWISGWEHIARYIDRSISTAKRYHYKYGMPVLHLLGGTPICLPYMLDTWAVKFDEIKRQGKKQQNDAKSQQRASEKPG